jgi:hypothetical protein
MPYDDEYNRKVARDTNYINKRFVEHTDALGTSQTINYRNPSVSGSGFSGGSRVIGGGVGCAEFKGASASKHGKGEHSKCPCGNDEDGMCMCGSGGSDMEGGTNLGRKSKDPVGASLSGGAILGLQDNTILGSKTAKRERKPRKKILFGSLGDSIPADMGVMAPTMPAATAVRASAIKDSNSPIETLRKGRGRPRKCASGKDETSSPMKAPRVKKGGNGFASGTHMDTGEGPATLGVKSRKTKRGGSTYNLEDPAKKEKRETNAKKYAAAKKEGSGVVDSVVEFVKNLVKPRKSYESKSRKERREDPLKNTKKYGRMLHGEAMKGGAEPVTDEAGNPLLPTTTKRTVKSTAKKEVKPMTEKAQLPSSTLSGLGKKAEPKAKKHNARAEVVKKVMAEHGMKMIEASKYVKEHGLY